MKDDPFDDFLDREEDDIEKEKREKKEHKENALIKLDYPVKIDTVEYSEVTMRRPKVKDQLAIDKIGGTPAEKEVGVISLLCRLDRKVIAEMDMHDYKKIQKRYAYFLE